MEQKKSWLFRGVTLLALCTLVACGTRKQAPIESRTGQVGVPAPTQGTTPATARAGYHIVKRGETLFSIAASYGQDYRDVAKWSGLTNPGAIEVGQELRIAPPGTDVVAGTEPAAGSGSTVETRPMDASGASATTSIKTEPQGGRIAYTPKAWNDLVVGNAQSAATSSNPSVSTTPAATTSAGSVDWSWPTNGKVIAGFNEATNKGLDIAGAVGDPVLASSAGKVVYVGSGLRGYGNLVIIKHNDTFLSAYAHNSEILVKEGQSVKKGQKIATVGSSDADRPKLHFEIRKQGKPVDPAQYLPSR